MEQKEMYFSLKREVFLERVLQDYEQKRSSPSEIAKKYGIARRTVYEWIANFAPNSKYKPYIRAKKMKDSTVQEPKSINIEDMAKLTPEEQVAYLKEALRKAELRADAYNTMIDIAESKFSIPIRKKAGVKQ